MSKPTLLTRHLGIQEYEATFKAMQAFTEQRDNDTISELWLVEHPPVFTQGLAGKAEHVLAAGDIPIVQTDRGGQVTYHGPGQLVAYLMISLKEADVGIRQLVTMMEESIIELLANRDIQGQARPDAPGVYVDNKKVASLGLKVRNRSGSYYTYHGLSLNVDMDLEPFQRINPCGFAGLEVTQLKDLGLDCSTNDAGISLIPKLCHKLGYQCQAADSHDLPQYSHSDFTA